MASTGKKGKKNKGKTMGLNDFLAEQAQPPPGSTVLIPRKPTSWCDDEDETDSYNDYSRKPAMPVYLPTAPRAARSNDIDESRIPKNPPYVAYLSNLSYDVEESDITEFFQDLNISNVRLPRDEKGGGGKLKGFGYVEFGDRASFVQALQIYETSIKGRRIRIEIADSNDNDRRRGGIRENRDRDSGHDEKTSGDWRSGPRSEPPPDDRRYVSGPRRDYGSYNDRRGQSDSRNDRDNTTWRDSSNRRFTNDSRSNFGSRRDEEPKTRPKLQLQPRTLPVEEVVVKEEPVKKEVEEVKRPAPVPAASIFGGAKPVDTSAREREIEERLAKEKEIKESRSPRSEPESEKSRPGTEREPAQDAKKLEAAPEPKENVWVRRSQRMETQNANVVERNEDRLSPTKEVQDDGEVDSRTSHDNDENADEKEPKSEAQDDREYETKDQDENRYNDKSREGDRPYRRDDRNRRDFDSDRRDRRDFDRRGEGGRYREQEGERRYNDREGDRRYNERRYDRDGDRDRRFNDRDGGDRERKISDRDGDRDRRYNDREGDRKYNDRDSERRYPERDGESRRNQDRDGSRYKDQEEGHKGGYKGERGDRRPNVDRTARQGKAPQDRGPRSERPREPKKPDDAVKMPKFKEAEAPNYVGKNKYSYLEENDTFE